MKTYSALRVAHPTFYYENYEISQDEGSIRITYHFKTDNLTCFSPSWVFPVEDPSFDISDTTFQTMVFNLGLAELVSYWKITCSPTVKILCGALSPSQINWWKKLYFHGLGEFFYLNGINADESFMRIECANSIEQISPSTRFLKGNLIPVGGGKDSNVTMELLKEFKEENTKNGT